MIDAWMKVKSCLWLPQGAEMLEDQIPFHYCLCSITDVNIKARGRESGLGALTRESNASLKGGKELELLFKGWV